MCASPSLQSACDGILNQPLVERVTRTAVNEVLVVCPFDPQHRSQRESWGRGTVSYADSRYRRRRSSRGNSIFEFGSPVPLARGSRAPSLAGQDTLDGQLTGDAQMLGDPSKDGTFLDESTLQQERSVTVRQIPRLLNTFEQPQLSGLC